MPENKIGGTPEQQAARAAIIAAGNGRIDAFLNELRAAVAPLLAKHGLDLPPADLLHHRAVNDRSPYCVLHFYVFAPPMQPGAKANAA